MGIALGSIYRAPGGGSVSYWHPYPPGIPGRAGSRERPVLCVFKMVMSPPGEGSWSWTSLGVWRWEWSY